MTFAAPVTPASRCGQETRDRRQGWGGLSRYFHSTPTFCMQIAWRLYPGLSGLPGRQSICRCTCCGPGPGCYHSKKQGNGTGKLIALMADFIEFPFFGEAGHGIYRQSFNVQRLRHRVCLHRRRAAFLPRQAVQKRAPALQAVQGEARPRRLQSAPGDPD